MRQNTGMLTFFLVLLTIFPIALTTLAWADVTFWNYVLVVERPSEVEDGVAPPVQRLKQSILHVRVPKCDGAGSSSGTSFVISPGYVATAAHVVSEHQACGSEMTLVDHQGIEHHAELSAYSADNDLAILSISENELEPLVLADSTQYENAPDMVALLTIGYPPTSSTAKEAAVSGVGNLSSFRDDVFFTSGMDLNPGNSGGPVFLTDGWQVLGVAVMKGDPDQGGDGLGIVVPSALLRGFFQERTGRSL